MSLTEQMMSRGAQTSFSIKNLSPRGKTSFIGSNNDRLPKIKFITQSDRSSSLPRISLLKSQHLKRNNTRAHISFTDNKTWVFCVVQAFYEQLNLWKYISYTSSKCWTKCMEIKDLGVIKWLISLIREGKLLAYWEIPNQIMTCNFSRDYKKNFSIEIPNNQIKCCSILKRIKM